MASLSMMTACGGDKKGTSADAEGENADMVDDNDQVTNDQDAIGTDSDADAEAWGVPATASLIDLAALYESGDFQPATTTIFIDSLADETAGELPSKWDIKEGSAEVGEAQGHKYITLSGGDSRILPLVNGNKAILTEKYTMEFEFMFGRDVWFYVNFFDAEDTGIADFDLWLSHINWNVHKTDDEWLVGNREELQEILRKDSWNHFAISYDAGNLKLFLNGKRIANLPNVIQASYFTIMGREANGESHYVTNVRVAK